MQKEKRPTERLETVIFLINHNHRLDIHIDFLEPTNIVKSAPNESKF